MHQHHQPERIRLCCMDGLFSSSCFWNDGANLSSRISMRREAAHLHSRRGSRQSDVISGMSFHLLILVLLLSVQPSEQVLEFLSEPAPYYYVHPGFITHIPCEAFNTQQDGSRVVANATFFRNSIPITPSTPPRHIWSIDSEQRIIGLLIYPTFLEDSLSVYSCRVEDGGDILVSQNATLYVGDGTPFPPLEPPYQLSETVSSVLIGWGYSPTPASAPILNYTISYWSRNQSRDAVITVARPDNETGFDLTGLDHGTEYFVAVQGGNSYGLGDASRIGVIITVRGESPPAPTNVNANVVVSDEGEITVNVSWIAPVIDLGVTTPVEDYLIFGNSTNQSDQLIDTVRFPSTLHELTLQDVGVYRVGVAARNSVGQSTIAYIQEDLNIILPTPQTTSMSTDTSETTDSIPQTTEETDSIPQTTEETDSIPQTTKETDSIPQTTEEMDSIPQTTEETDSIPHTTEETDSIPRTTEEIDSIPQTTGNVSITKSQGSGSGSGSTITIVGVVVASSVLLILLSGLVFLLTFYIRIKMKSLDSANDRSPSSSENDGKDDVESDGKTDTHQSLPMTDLESSHSTKV